MAVIPRHLPSLIVFLVLICPIAHSKRVIPNAQLPSPFDFLKTLQGRCHLGNSTHGLNKLKHYLNQFGYLKYQNQTRLNDDMFDTKLESALKTYQENYHVTPTGTLDAATVSKMTSPRCGVPDIVDGVNTMRRNHDLHHPQSKSIHTTAHYTFFPGRPRWPRSKRILTYRFIRGTRLDAIAPIRRAFRQWASATHFRFRRVAVNRQSDIVIGFFSRNHGDGSAFDGGNGVLAHAFAPTNGRLHYDADEYWVNGAVQGGYDLQTVALHEIGHLLGLDHSTVRGAIMWPQIVIGQTKGLHRDDINGIRALYNV